MRTDVGGWVAVITLEIGDKTCRQKQIAGTYAELMLQSARENRMGGPHFADVNRRIIERWSLSGLERIKRMAWKEAAIMSGEA